MKKTRPISSGYQGEKYFQEHLQRTAIELYEWHLMLHYFWLSDVRHNRIRQVSGAPCINGATYLCEECHKALLNSGEYILDTVIHDPKTHSFPPRYDDSVRLSIKATCDAEFEKESLDMLNEIKKDEKDIPFFPDDAAKEYALVYLDQNLEERKDIPLDNRNLFHVLSIEARCLSIIYENFFEYKNLIKWQDWELIEFITNLKDDVIGDSHEMIGYWKLSDIKKKIQSSWSKSGGKANKKPLGIVQAIKSLIQTTIIDAGYGINNFNAAALSRVLWDYFKENHDDSPFLIDDYKVLFNVDTNRLEQMKDNDKKIIFNSVGFDRFKKHVSAILKEMK
jgi:hypothetical protein